MNPWLYFFHVELWTDISRELSVQNLNLVFPITENDNVSCYLDIEAGFIIEVT